MSDRDHPLVQDIYKVVQEGADVTPEQVEEFGRQLSNIIANRLKEDRSSRAFTLRMSNIGRGARQLWYQKRYEPNEKLEGHTLIKFIIGDIAESLVLFLAKVAGHSVTDEQSEVTLDGIKGHIDADIDGVTVDVKSASQYQFKKFKYGTIAEDDAFGYIDQLGGYAKARNTDGAFLALDKSSGHLAYLQLSQKELGVDGISDRIKYLKEAVESEEIPKRCYDDQEEGASGNRVLGVNCSYCPFKTRCWADSNGGIGLRTFLYSNGPKFFTEVKREPKVHEVTF